MIPERFWQLWSKKLAGEATHPETEELSRLMELYPACRTVVDKLDEQMLVEQPADTSEAEAAFAALLVKMELSGQLDAAGEEQQSLFPSSIKKRRSTWWLTGIAASVLLMVLAGYWWQHSVEGYPRVTAHKNEVVTQKGSSSKITLPDNSTVWLNADSKLSYAPDFQTGNREVYLTGEAFFDVAKDSSKPFIIHTEKIDIKVLGTAFNLKSYPEDDLVETALIHGKIEVTFKDRPSEKIILNPNEKLTVNKNQMRVTTPASTEVPKVEIAHLHFMKDSLVEETAWVENKLVFTDESFAEIAKLLERKYDVSFRFSDEEVKAFSYTGIFEHESLEKILALMSLSQDFSYSIKGRDVVVGK